jgi:predicted transglutaminase-like cysteine proteinase
MRLLFGTFSRVALTLGVGMTAFFSIPAVAQSTAPQSSPIPSGSFAEPPQGYLDFCARHSDQCEPARPNLAVGSLEPGSAAISSGDDTVHPASTFLGDSGQKFDWQRVFTSAATVGPLQVRPKGNVAGGAARAAFPAMTAEFWHQLETVNRTVNVSVRSVSDAVHYGLQDYWELPFQGGQNAGDCEDYVLQKRQMLLARGIPMTALSIALVKTSWGEPHAVLLVRSSQGDYVLDNLTPWIEPWTQVSYSWIKWQSGDNPEAWVRPSVR